MRRLSALLFVTCVSLLCVSAFGEDACSKSYTKWTEEYSRKVLANSPWSKPFVLARVHSQAEGYEREDVVEDPNAGEKEIYNAYTLRLFSALPVRQAFVRMFHEV